MSSERRKMPEDLADSTAPRTLTAFAARGPEALSPTESAARKTARRRNISAFRLQPHPLQPHERHSTENVAELKVSLSELGLIEPPLVWHHSGSSYVILAGHRRWHAWKLLVAEENRDPRMPVYVLDGISGDEALRIMAAEYCHRKEFSVIHTARIVGAAHESLRQNGSVPLRQLAAVMPLGRTSLGQYLVISDGLHDPRLAPLVHSVDKPSKVKLYKALSYPDIQTRIAALKAMQTGSQGLRTSIMIGPPSSRTACVRRRKRGRGFDLAVEVRLNMAPAEVLRVVGALRGAIADVEVLFPTHAANPGPGIQTSEG